MADEQNLSYDERCKKRNELAAPICCLLKLKEKTYPTVLPKIRMGKQSVTPTLYATYEKLLKDCRLKIITTWQKSHQPIAYHEKLLFCVSTRLLRILP
jgi:hypothetical protein